jgi:hypothetical protein
VIHNRHTRLIALLVFLVQLFVSHLASIYLYNQFQGLRRGNERDIFEIALDGTSLFRGSCIDVIKSRLRKKLKAPASSRIMPFLKEGEIPLILFSFLFKIYHLNTGRLDYSVANIVEHPCLTSCFKTYQHLLQAE